MFIPLLIYISIGIIWNIKQIKFIRKGFKTAVEKCGREPSIAESLFTLMLTICLWLPIEIYSQIRGRQIAKENKEHKED